MKFFKILAVAFIISFIVLGTNTLAWSETTYSTSLRNNSGVTTQGTLEKPTQWGFTQQVLVINSIESNRQFNFKVNEVGNSSLITSWFTIEPTGSPTFAHYRGNCSNVLYSHTDYVLCMGGNKQLQQRTTKSYSDTTTIYGRWFVVADEFNDCRSQGIWYCQ